MVSVKLSRIPETKKTIRRQSDIVVRNRSYMFVNILIFVVLYLLLILLDILLVVVLT